MQNIIQYAYKIIDNCADCSYREACGWFTSLATNVDLNLYPREENPDKTYEELTLETHGNLGSPDCGGQSSIDAFFDHVEYLLECASFPILSQDLITLLNKMARLENRPTRRSSDCVAAFDLIIRAIVERCLSELDYHYLDEDGIDISPLIFNIHSDYHRIKMLHQYHLPGVVDVLLSKSRKLSLEQIVDWKGRLSDLKDIKTYTIKYPIVEDNVVPDDLPAPEPAKEPELREFLIPDGTSAVKEVFLRFAGFEALEPITALLIKTGYLNYSHVGFMEGTDIDPDEWADSHYGTWTRFKFDRWGELKDEISSEIKKRVKDELELKKYVCSLITPFERFIYYRGFDADTKEWVEAMNVVDCFIFPPSIVVDKFVMIWKEVIGKLREDDAKEKYSLEEYAKQIRDRYDNRLMQEEVITDIDEATAFGKREEFPHNYCGLIAGCLLENGASLEYLDYQDMCGVQLVDKPTYFDVAISMGWTEDLVASYHPKRVKASLFEEDPVKEEKTAPVLDDRPVKVSFGDITTLPKGFQTRKAAELWEKAYKSGVIDEHFKPKGTRLEQSLFAGLLSQALFGKIDWVAMYDWHPYKYYAQKFDVISSRSRDKQSELGKTILDIFG